MSNLRKEFKAYLSSKKPRRILAEFKTAYREAREEYFFYLISKCGLTFKEAGRRFGVRSSTAEFDAYLHAKYTLNLSADELRIKFPTYGQHD